MCRNPGDRRITPEIAQRFCVLTIAGSNGYPGVAQAMQFNLAISAQWRDEGFSSCDAMRCGWRPEVRLRVSREAEYLTIVIDRLHIAIIGVQQCHKSLFAIIAMCALRSPEIIFS